MRIKVVGQTGERVYECEDVTVTYYGQETLAFKDASAAYDARVREAAELREGARARMEQGAARAAVAASALAVAEQRADSVATRGRYRNLLWRVAAALGLGRGAYRAADVDALRRAAVRAAADHVALEAVYGAAARAHDGLALETLTPGMELAMRARGSRELVVVLLPQDGDSAYVMNDSGKTIDSYHWPPRRMPAAASNH